MGSFSSFRKYLRLATSLKRFLSQPISVETARDVVRRGWEYRETAFLDIIGRAVFSYPRSPYLSLLRAARCELGDIQNMVRRDGVEGTLTRLRDVGVYVTWEEFKGRAPAVRGGQVFQYCDRDFDNPLIAGHYEVSSGGSSGTPARIVIDLEDHAHTAAHLAIWFASHGWIASPLIFWEPNHTGMVNRFLRCAKFGKSYTKWFINAKMASSADRLKASSLHGLVRLLGGFAKPEFVPLQQAGKIADFLAAMSDEGTRPIVNTSPSAAALVAQSSMDRGLRLRGVSFLLGGEPLTQARRRLIEASGANAVPLYGTSECSAIGAQFPGAAHADEVCVFRDVQVVVPQTFAVVQTSAAVPLLHTCLRPACPKIMLNTELGDCAVLETRCDDQAFSEFGYDLRLHTIRSFRKLTGYGVTLAVAELCPVLEETLPRRFGGNPSDYQLLEEQDGEGRCQYSLLVSPAVGKFDSDEVERVFLEELGKRKAHYRAMAEMWVQSKAIRVVCRRPVSTSRGKTIPVLTLRRPDHEERA